MATSDDDFDNWRPTIVEVMAEYGGTFLWDRSPEPGPGPTDYYGPVGLDPGILDVSSDLADRLSAWNEEWESGAAADWDEEADDDADMQEWVQRGRELTRELQDELPDVQVLYSYDKTKQDKIDNDAE